MKLITLLIALVFERFLDNMDEIRGLGWFRRYLNWIYGHLNPWGTQFGVVLALAPPLLVILVISHLVDNALLGLLEIAFGVAVLLYCLGPKDLEAEIDAYLEADAQSDGMQEQDIAADFVDGAIPMDRAARVRAITEGIFAEANNRQFAVILWFLILGPFGAALYRLADQWRRIETDERGPNQQSTARLTGFLDWIPARLTVLGYALVGSFEHAWQVSRDRWFSIEEPIYEHNRMLLKEAGRAALRFDQQMNDDVFWLDPAARFNTAIDLVIRALLMWITLLALVTLAGWVT